MKETNKEDLDMIYYQEELTKVLPKGINKFLFSDNGSSCIEMALKLSLQAF